MCFNNTVTNNVLTNTAILLQMTCNSGVYSVKYNKLLKIIKSPKSSNILTYFIKILLSAAVLECTFNFS